VFYKSGAARLPEILTNWPLLAGIACYAVGAVLLTLSLRGGEVSVLYPLFATSYLWVTIAAYFVYGESIGALKVIGIMVIIAGLSAIGYGSRTSAVATLPPEVL
jgi:multidrug transporter EmrE-like cation transporter